MVRLIFLWGRNWPAFHFHTVLPIQPPIRKQKPRIMQWDLHLICHVYDRIITSAPSIHLHDLSVCHRHIFTSNLLFSKAHLHNSLTWGVANSSPISLQYKRGTADITGEQKGSSEHKPLVVPNVCPLRSQTPRSQLLTAFPKFRHNGEKTRHQISQCFSTFVRPRPGKFFFFYKTRARPQQIYL